ncbi:MAG TPA: hypothetical protein VN755_00450 [Steroidobacteraceae bacterium]|nr:hypothetical protein [Steroidobacteraceae bacterium]
MTEQRGYEEGVADGRVIQELREHAEHLRTINGSTERVAERLASIELLLQQIVDKADFRAASAAAEQSSRDATVISVATALEKKEQAKMDNSTKRWEPWKRTLAMASGLVALIGAVITIIATR